MAFYYSTDITAILYIIIVDPRAKFGLRPVALRTQDAYSIFHQRPGAFILISVASATKAR